jgi:hypothetical protein
MSEGWSLGLIPQHSWAALWTAKQAPEAREALTGTHRLNKGEEMWAGYNPG